MGFCFIYLSLGGGSGCVCVLRAPDGLAARLVHPNVSLTIDGHILFATFDRDIVIPDGELEVSTMRSGGSGGQNVNKVETGVRMKHIPTGIAVRCTQERSQMLNKDLALNMLKEKLVVVMQEQQTKDLAEIRCVCVCVRVCRPTLEGVGINLVGSTFVLVHQCGDLLFVAEKCFGAAFSPQ